MLELQDICRVWIKIIWVYIPKSSKFFWKKWILCSNFINSYLRIKPKAPFLTSYSGSSVWKMQRFFFFFFLSLSIYTIVITIKCSNGHVYTQKVTVTSVLYHLTKKVVLIFIYTLKIYYKISFVGRILFQIEKLFTEVKRLR